MWRFKAQSLWQIQLVHLTVVRLVIWLLMEMKLALEMTLFRYQSRCFPHVSHDVSPNKLAFACKKN